MSREEFTVEDILDAPRRAADWNKPRPKGSVPYLTDSIRNNPEWLRDWLTVALRPGRGWRVMEFEHTDDLDAPCSIVVANGTDNHRHRLNSTRELSSAGRLRTSLTVKGFGHIPHLGTAEAGDVFQALCLLTEASERLDEIEQSREWLTEFVEATDPMEGLSMTSGPERRDALLALKRRRQFTRLDALAATRRPDEPTWIWRPVRLIDRISGDLWLRSGEAATFLRHILGITPLRQIVLTARWKEIGVDLYRFQDRAHPHPKAKLYRVAAAK